MELSNEMGSRTLRFNEDMETRPWWTPCPEKNYLLGQYFHQHIYYCGVVLKLISIKPSVGSFEDFSYCPKENVVRLSIKYIFSCTCDRCNLVMLSTFCMSNRTKIVKKT